MSSFEVFFYDLKKEKQIDILNFFNIETPEDKGLDIIPLFTLEKESD